MCRKRSTGGDLVVEMAGQLLLHMARPARLRRVFQSFVTMAGSWHVPVPPHHAPASLPNSTRPLEISHLIISEMTAKASCHHVCASRHEEVQRAYVPSRGCDVDMLLRASRTERCLATVFSVP
jgi:hypothetical protein